MARASAHQRALAARAIREGKSYAQAAKIAGVSKWTIVQWMKDPDFLALVHGPGVITLGHATIVRAHETDIVDLPVEESWLWINSASNAVVGSLLVQDATQLRAAFITPDRVAPVREALAQKQFPERAGERLAVLAPAALKTLQDDPNALATLTRICTGTPADAFRAFLSLWHFRAQETKDVRLLGDQLWQAQEQFIGEIAAHEHVYALKARKLGQSTIACAYDGFVLRFRDPTRACTCSHAGRRPPRSYWKRSRSGLSSCRRTCACPPARPHTASNSTPAPRTDGSPSATRPRKTRPWKRPRPGRLIVFGSYSNEGLQPGLSRNLYLVRPDGTGLVALTHAKGGTEQNYQPSWSPDGRWIAFTREPNAQRTPRIHGDNDVYVMRADDTDLRRIAAPPRNGGFDVDWGR